MSSGSGGPSQIGSAGRGLASANGTGNNAAGYGAGGGGGGASGGSGAVSGGTGSPGVVVINEYVIA